MDRYKSLIAWQKAHEIAKRVLAATDDPDHPRKRALFDQMRRAAISVEANIVEGYALGTTALFKRHLRIAFASAAEVECLARLAGEAGYIEEETVAGWESILGECMSTIHGLRKRPVYFRA